MTSADPSRAAPPAGLTEDVDDLKARTAGLAGDVAIHPGRTR